MSLRHKQTPPPGRDGVARSKEAGKSCTFDTAKADNPTTKIAKSATAEVRVSLTSWRGEHKVELREFTATIPAVFMSTSSGFTLPVAKLPELIDALRATERQARARGLIGGAA